MRFGRRKRGPSIWGRQTRSGAERNEDQADAVKSEERSALLTRPQPSESPPLEGGGQPEKSAAISASDPTQKLLAVLGRFKRHVKRGEQGAGQDEWSDDCMDELINAAEIAVAQGWEEVIEALTGAGRVLQSYENAGCAHLAAPFLLTSHEMLCLMASDLIVGRVRPGALKKWRASYEEAVEDIEAAGLSLVEDGEEPPEDEAPAEAPFVPPQIHRMESAPASEAPADPPAEEPAPPADDAAKPAEQPASESADEPSPEPAAPQPQPQPQSASASEDAAHVLPERITALLDQLCDDLTRLEHGGAGEAASAGAAVLMKIAQLESFARDGAKNRAVQLCRTMAKLSEWAVRAGHATDEAFIELAYAFCEAYDQATNDDEDPVVKNWLLESQRLVKSWQQLLAQKRGQGQPPAEAQAPEPAQAPERTAAPAPQAPAETTSATVGEQDAPAEEAAAPAEEASAEQQAPEPPVPGKAAPEAPPPVREDNALKGLLQAAERAAQAGEVSDAKVLVLRAAANLAKAETVKAQDRVREAEMGLREGNEAIEAARDEVKKAEHGVIESERRVSDGKRLCEDARARMNRIVELRKDMDERIARIDEQIAELQAQRDVESERLFQAGQALEEAQKKQSEAEDELRGLRTEEESVRERLESSRQNVKELLRKRSEVEADLGAAREMLARQKASLADIEQTIAQLVGGGAAQEGEDPQHLLF